MLVEEPGSDLANEAYDRSQSAATSALAYVEASSALARMRKGGRISTGRYRSALNGLDDRWNELDIHGVTDCLIARASHATTDHALSAYDSLHLATIVSFADVEYVTVACWDRDLRKAAQDYGYALAPERL